jgi:hypothetical protein
MGKKVLLATLAGSLIVFLVSSIWHLTPALGELGVKSLPSEESVLQALRTAIPDPGFYFFPAPGSDQAATLAKFKQGPTGILVYKPGGEGFNFAKALLSQFLFGLIAAFILACILALAAPATTYGQRVLLVLLVVAFAGALYELPEWNWYGFPALYILGHFASWLVSWAAAGLVMARIVKPDASVAGFASAR